MYIHTYSSQRVFSSQDLPEVRLDNTRIGQFVGKEAVLDCEVSASPLGYAVWKHNGK